LVRIGANEPVMAIHADFGIRVEVVAHGPALGYRMVIGADCAAVAREFRGAGLAIDQHIPEHFVEGSVLFYDDDDMANLLRNVTCPGGLSEAIILPNGSAESG